MDLRTFKRGAWCSLALSTVFVAAGLAAATSVVPASASTAAKDTLVVLEDDIAAGLDYDGASIVQQDTHTVINNLMEPLLAYPTHKVGDILVPNYKVQGSQEYVPRLATSWTKKGLAWTFHLRKGVKSCDGNELTADDVVYTLGRAKSVSGAVPIGWFMNNVAGILPLDPVKPGASAAAKQLKGEVVKVDKYTVRFTQMTPNELFPRNLTLIGLLIFDSKEMLKHATSSDPWSHRWSDTTNAPGFGPYCLKSWNKGSEIRLTSNPAYYRGQPQFKNVLIRKVATNSTRIAAIEAGSADIVTNLVPREYTNVAKSSNVSVLKWQNNKILALGLSANFAPWKGPKNKLVRQAVAYALPYGAIIHNDYLDIAKRWYGACESSYHGYVPIHRYDINLAKAKALMAQAGYPGGKGLPNGSLTLYYPAERAALLEPIANRIRTSLAQIGMNIQLSPISGAEYSDRRITKYDMSMFIEEQDRPLMPDVGYCALLWYVSKKNGGVNTPSAYDSPQFDALYKQSSTTVGATRLVALRKMQELLMQDLPVVPIAEPASVLAVRKGITNWLGTTFDSLSFFEFKSA